MCPPINVNAFIVAPEDADILNGYHDEIVILRQRGKLMEKAIGDLYRL